MLVLLEIITLCKIATTGGGIEKIMLFLPQSRPQCFCVNGNRSEEAARAVRGAQDPSGSFPSDDNAATGIATKQAQKSHPLGGS